MYPAAARSLKLYGTVKISVVINEEGDVIEAQAFSGHPILRTSAIAAALKATFQPIILRGEPIKVSGIIFYRFVSDEYNWLDIGNKLKTSSFSEMLPFGFDEEKKLAESYEKAEAENQILILQTIRALIENKISDNSRNLWLFRIGILLSEIDSDCYSTENLNKLKVFLINPPEKVSRLLIEKLKTLVQFSEQDSNQVPVQLSEIKENIDWLGN